MSGDKGLYSVIIPVFNDSENLFQCLSALQSARKERSVDMIVVDDGSNDDSETVARRFDVRYFKNEANKGQSWCRNFGVSQTGSEFIIFVDSDVVVFPDFFERIDAFACMEKSEGLIGLQGVFSLEHPFESWPSQLYNTLQHLLTRKPRYCAGINTSALVMNRQAFLDTGGFDEQIWFMEDNEFAQRMAARGMYVLRGNFEFVHRKHVSWSWLFYTHFLGGKMQHCLSELKSTHEIPLPAGVSQNRFFLKNLGAGMMTLVVAALMIVSDDLLKLVPVILLQMILIIDVLKENIALWRVKKNYYFFITGTCVYLSLPWLIIAGRIMGRFSTPGTRERLLWRKKQTPPIPVR
ncbi:MAG: glycosyltransferase family 2 protein [Desulfobacteraceae bacterium]|jgi:glycosyltransferase involved in cell wall biosynthesis